MFINRRMLSASLILLATILPDKYVFAADAARRLQQAIANPEYLLENEVNLPVAPGPSSQKAKTLSLREAIFLALRYNPNIQNAELDRILQRYQLRLAHNEFELQYALTASAAIEKSRFSGVGDTTSKSFLAAPELKLKTRLGSELSLNLSNNVSGYDSYAPVLNLSLTQPLLRGFGKAVNETKLLNAIDNEFLNKINLQQAVMDQITQVISSYRALILSGNNLDNQRRQLQEAKKTFATNEKKIAAGQLEPTANVQQSYQIESLSLMVEQASNTFKMDEQNLLQTIGLDPEMRVSVPDDIQIKRIRLPDLQQSIELALANNAEYLTQKMILRADERAYTVAKNQQLWRLDLTAKVQSGMVTDANNRPVRGIYNGRNINESANLSLTVPIRDLEQRNQLIAAKIALEKDRLKLISLRRSLITTLKNTINTITSQARSYQLAEKQVKLAAQSYALEKKKQQAGITSALDVNNTQNQLIQAQAGLISAKIAYLNQLSTLHRLLGITLKEWHITLRYGE